MISNFNRIHIDNQYQKQNFSAVKSEKNPIYINCMYRR